MYLYILGDDLNANQIATSQIFNQFIFICLLGWKCQMINMLMMEVNKYLIVGLFLARQKNPLLDAIHKFETNIFSIISAVLFEEVSLMN